MSAFTIQTFRGGFSDHDDKGLPGAAKFLKNADIRKKVDSLSCQQALVDETVTGLDSVMNFIIPCTDGNAYGFCRNGKIFKRTSGGTWSLVYTDTNETTLGIIGAWQWSLNTGKTYLFWRTATRLNCKEIPGNATWSIDVNALAGYPKTNLTSATWGTMRDCNGTLQICNSNTLAFVGYDGSYTNNALQLIPGNVANTIIERGVYTIVGCGRGDNLEQSAMFQWDGISQNFNDKKIVPIASITAMIDTEVPLMQVGSNGYIFYSDMSDILPIITFPGGGKVNPAAVANDSGVALFGVYGNGAGNTGIYSYGRRRKNDNFVPNLEYQFDCDEIGAVVKVGTDILVTYKNGSSYGVKKVDTTTKATFVYQSIDLKAPTKDKFGLYVWGYVVLTMAPLPASASVSVAYRLDKTGSWVTANLQGNATSFTTVNGTEAIFLIGGKAKFLELQITGVPSGNNGPEVYKAEISLE